MSQKFFQGFHGLSAKATESYLHFFDQNFDEEEKECVDIVCRFCLSFNIKVQAVYTYCELLLKGFNFKNKPFLSVVLESYAIFIQQGEIDPVKACECYLSNVDK